MIFEERERGRKSVRKERRRRRKASVRLCPVHFFPSKHKKTIVLTVVDLNLDGVSLKRQEKKRERKRKREETAYLFRVLGAASRAEVFGRFQDVTIVLMARVVVEVR